MCMIKMICLLSIPTSEPKRCHVRRPLYMLATGCLRAAGGADAALALMCVQSLTARAGPCAEAGVGAEAVHRGAAPASCCSGGLAGQCRRPCRGPGKQRRQRKVRSDSCDLTVHGCAENADSDADSQSCPAAYHKVDWSVLGSVTRALVRQLTRSALFSILAQVGDRVQGDLYTHGLDA
jgi:hypothetical protein